MSKKERKIERLRNKLIGANDKVETLIRERNKFQREYRSMQEQKEFFERAYERHKGKINVLSNENKQVETLIVNMKNAMLKYENAVSFDKACGPNLDAKYKPNLTFDDWGCPLNHEDTE